MSIGSFIKKQFIDVLQWNEDADGTLAWRYPMEDFEIQYGASLTVRDSQMAVFVNEGKVAAQKAVSLLAVKSPGGMRFPAQGESNEANWTSSYTLQANETGWWEDLVDILRANQAVFDGTILTVDQEANLGASRRITAGDGIGFDETKINHNANGWNNIKSRVSLLHGHLQFHSEPQKGTSVTIVLQAQVLTTT